MNDWELLINSDTFKYFVTAIILIILLALTFNAVLKYIKGD